MIILVIQRWLVLLSKNALSANMLYIYYRRITIIIILVQFSLQNYSSNTSMP